MSYIMLDNERIKNPNREKHTLDMEALSFIRESCEGLRFDRSKSVSRDNPETDYEGTSLKPNQIPFNMEKDIDRLCLENAIERFLKSGKKDDAFEVYFCYLEMFIGDYEKTRRMIELLSEFEANGGGLLMKHRDHYVHSVYVFVLGLAIYQSNEIYRETYKKYYRIENANDAAAHFLQYWGLSALFHDIGYPFELPFEQVCSYFEMDGNYRKDRPFVAYNSLDSFTDIKDEKVKSTLKELFRGKDFTSTDEVFAYVICDKLGQAYDFTYENMFEFLREKPTHPEKFNHFMDHAYFSATVLFHKLFCEMGILLKREHMDALSAILMHNSLYKFCIAHYKNDGNKPIKPEQHPLAYLLMLCDELQCWDRTAYGRNSKKELHPMGCRFDFSDNKIKAVYLYDKNEIAKINLFKDKYIEWLDSDKEKLCECPMLKAYSGMYIKKDGLSEFQQDIERIVELIEIRLSVETSIEEHIHEGNRGYLSESNFINLYNFAVVLNGRWESDGWKKAKEENREEEFLNDESVKAKYLESFKKLSLEYKLSNINQAKAFARYMSEIGCFYTDKEVDFEMLDKFSAEELLKIGVLEHKRWLQEHYDMGWSYGEPADKDTRERERRHKDMIPGFNGFEVSTEDAKANYKRLDKEEQDKDTEPMECMLAMLRMFGGLRIYRYN